MLQKTLRVRASQTVWSLQKALQTNPLTRKPPEGAYRVYITIKILCVVTDFPESSLTCECQLYHKADTFRRRHRCVRQHSGSSSTPKP